MNTPAALQQAMSARAAAGLYASVHPEDGEAFKAAGGGVLSIYAKDKAQLDDYCARVRAMGCRVVHERVNWG